MSFIATQVAIPFPTTERLGPEITFSGVGKENRNTALQSSSSTKEEATLSEERLFARVGQGGERLRVAYLADFKDSATIQLMGSILKSHSRSRFQIYCYSLGHDIERVNGSSSPSNHPSGRGYMMERLQSKACDVFRSFGGVATLIAAQMINDDGISILVDLLGYLSPRPEIVMLKAAPVIVNWPLLGWYGTMGAPEVVEYMITDPHLMPSTERNHYSEHAIILPHSFYAYSPFPSAAEEKKKDRLLDDGGGEKPESFILSQPSSSCLAMDTTPASTTSTNLRGCHEDCGLSSPHLDERFVFCNLNDHVRIDMDTFDAWMAILDQVPDSILLLASGLPSASEENLLQEASRRGIARERIAFIACKSDTRLDHNNNDHHQDLLARCFNCADLYLDTLTYNSDVLSLVSALMNAVPVVTLQATSSSSSSSSSSCLGSRISSSFLSTLDLFDLIARDRQDYIELAVRLARSALKRRRGRHNNNKKMMMMMDDQAATEGNYNIVPEEMERPPAGQDKEEEEEQQQQQQQQQGEEEEEVKKYFS